MGLNSNIEWTDHTWNPWYGCHKVSEGCRNCYMYMEQAHYGRDPSVVKRSKTTFNDPLRWAKMARRRGERYKVFVCSWSDFFIEEADEWRNEAWQIIRQTPELIYMILTKRPERIRQCLPEEGWFPRNVWWGVSIELEKYLLRWDILDDTFTFSRPNIFFLSIEPLLNFLSLESIIHYKNMGDDLYPCWTHPPDWVIVGGESGPKSRPCHPDWVRSIRDQCMAANVPFFFKQWGEYLPLEPTPILRSLIDVDYVKVGRKQAGAVLDGREWREFPMDMQS